MTFRLIVIVAVQRNSATVAPAKLVATLRSKTDGTATPQVPDSRLTSAGKRCRRPPLAPSRRYWWHRTLSPLQGFLAARLRIVCQVVAGQAAAETVAATLADDDLLALRKFRAVEPCWTLLTA